MKTMTTLAAGLLACAALALPAAAAEPRETWFEDLIPEGVAPAEIVGMGEMNAAADTWKPEYDENAVRYNVALDDTLIRMPGYIVPLTGDADGVTSFLLVPYVGACIHVPPPPPNQIVFVSTPKPWKNDMWDPVWVTGTLKIQSLSTELAEVGYTLEATGVELYTEE